MGLFVSTVSGDVSIPELGITLSHPATDVELSAQFDSEDLKYAASLTSAITGGSLNWKKTSGGAIELNADYDPDFLDVDQENTGTGEKDDRAATFKDIPSPVDIYEDDELVVEEVEIINFEDNFEVIDEGDKKVTVKAVGDGNSGSQPGEKYCEESYGQSTTKSGAWQDKVVMTETFEGGTYEFSASALYSHEDTGVQNYLRVRVDSTNYKMVVKEFYNYKYEDGAWHDYKVRKCGLALSEGSHTIKIQYHSSDDKYMFIKEANLIVKKTGS